MLAGPRVRARLTGQRWPTRRVGVTPQSGETFGADGMGCRREAMMGRTFCSRPSRGGHPGPGPRTEPQPETAGEVNASAPRALVMTVTRRSGCGSSGKPPDRTIRRLQGRPNERKSPQECIPSPSCRPEQPQETMPLRFWHRLREDGGQGSGSRPEPERQTRPSEMKVSLRTRRQALSEPVLRTADGVDPSGQRVVRGPSQRQQGSPRLRPEVGPGPQVRSPAPRGAVRKP